ncbi:papain-like cysteine protease family protein [Thalassomonas sp. RHCl1]|uniref:papain-like cysteine protease family protein n=1 Tax=Thalassomonas sp. RHCl1 TaxID=2995320 RepID=UPI00248BC0B8|nr:papain-like cysteine protease family protein [Thalassomonas sp. RHCl1]
MTQIEGVKCEHQQGVNLCWAATSLCVMDYYRKYNLFPASQQELKVKFTGGKDAKFDVIHVLEAYNISNGTDDKHPRIGNILESIRMNEPMILQIGPKDNMHFVVLIGYKKVVDKMYIILDPLDEPPVAKELTLSELGIIQGLQYTKAPRKPRGCKCSCTIL